MRYAAELPHWDMSVVFPGLDSAEFEAGFQAVYQEMDAAVSLFDTHHIDRQDFLMVDAVTIEIFQRIVETLNPLQEHVQLVGAYINSFITTEAQNALAQSRRSEFQPNYTRLQQLHIRFTAWIGSLDIETLLQQSPFAQTYAFFLRQAGRQSRYLMSPSEESLASDLNVTAGNAWALMYNNITAQLSIPVKQKEKTEILPMAAVRNLAYAEDAETREAAYHAELAGWKTVEIPLAAALNSIKGEVITLAKRRGWHSPLDASLFDTVIDRQTLSVMLDTAREYFPHFRRYLSAKAHLLGKDRLPWYDLLAPVGNSASPRPYNKAKQTILEQFHQYSPRLGEFAERAFRENWIDAEPRPGKRDGAFCMRLRGEESRVCLNYESSYKSTFTLAHELGHAYHNFNLAIHPPLNRDTPMTLAETASIFCETMVRNALMAQIRPEEALGLLDPSIMRSFQTVVDISSRYLFEEKVFAQRKHRALSPAEFCAIMLDTQKETYGDALDENAMHPYMWTAKLHYYSTDRSYYNYPYMFGQLFGLGLYARYRQDPEPFKAAYDDLLASTGLSDAAGLAARMGIDLHQADFWRGSLETIRTEIDRFIEMAV